MGAFHEDQYTFMIISRSVLVRMRNISGIHSKEIQSTHFMFKNFFSKIVPFMRKRGKVLLSWTGHRTHCA